MGWLTGRFDTPSARVPRELGLGSLRNGDGECPIESPPGGWTVTYGDGRGRWNYLVLLCADPEDLRDLTINVLARMEC